jgi:hypothetical protein
MQRRNLRPWQAQTIEAEARDGSDEITWLGQLQDRGEREGARLPAKALQANRPFFPPSPPVTTPPTPEQRASAVCDKRAFNGVWARLLLPAWGKPEGCQVTSAFGPLAIVPTQRHPPWSLSLQTHPWLGVR